jgi:hypothetical protein
MEAGSAVSAGRSASSRCPDERQLCCDNRTSDRVRACVVPITLTSRRVVAAARRYLSVGVVTVGVLWLPGQ